ncbi:MAG: hypothetical protein CMC08_09110 [Flavobacteriaceae bacterium]|nr:hypothetical protein [Flavobacteriaceae bacterium]
MKIKLLSLFVLIGLCSCKSDDDLNQDNPFLLDPLVDLTLNLNLPEYNQLRFPSGSVQITQQGIKGIVIYNINNEQYSAFELSDPNHTPNSCSKMTVEGIVASCPCPDDTNSYNIVTGQHTENPEVYPMQAYRIVRSGNTIRVTN